MEIERALNKHGAAQVVHGWDVHQREGFVAFTLDGRQFRRAVPARRPKGCEDAKQIDRERWRVLLLVIKAKLELVASGGANAEQEFLADLVLPDGSTLGTSVAPRIAEAYESGTMPKLMLGSGE